MGNGVPEVADVSNVLAEFHVFWSLLWPMTFRIDIWKAVLDVALVGLFGEGWVHQEFSSLPLKIRDVV
jgi:hypothetical protein